MRRIAHLGAVALVAAMVTLGGGCGDDSDDDSATQPNQASDTTNASSGDSEDDAGTSSGTNIPDIADATWNSGRIHVEVTGDVADNFESDGSGATLNGQTSAAYTSNEGRTVSIGLGGDLDSAIALTLGDVATTGAFGKDCDLSFTKNDASGLAADFTCPELKAIGTSATKIYTISVKGNFTLAP